MVVPRAEPRCDRVRRLQVWVRLVLRMPRAIVGQRHDLMRGLMVAPKLLAHHAAIARDAIFVDVVSEMDHRVDPALGAAFGDLAIGVEETERPVRARHDSHAVIRRALLRQCPRHAARRRSLAHREPVIVHLPRLQPVDIDLDRVVALRPRRDRPALDHILERRVPRQRPADRHRPVRLGRYPRPQHDGRLGRVARRHPVAERGLARIGGSGRCSGCAGRSPQPRHPKSKRPAPCQPGHGFILPTGILAPFPTLHCIATKACQTPPRPSA